MNLAGIRSSLFVAVGVVGLGISGRAMAGTNETPTEDGGRPADTDDGASLTTIRIDSSERPAELRLHWVLPPGDDAEYITSDEGRMLCSTPCTLRLPTGWYGLALNDSYRFDIEAAGVSRSLLVTDEVDWE
jgi:hypothetical protein